MEELLGPVPSYEGFSIVSPSSPSEVTVTISSSEGTQTLTLKDVEIVEVADGDLDPEEGLPLQGTPHFVSITGILQDDE